MLRIPLKHAVKTDIKRPLMAYLAKDREKSMSLADKLQKFNIFTPPDKPDSTVVSLNTAFVSLHDLRKEVADICEVAVAPTLVHYRTILKYYAQLNFMQGA